MYGGDAGLDAEVQRRIVAAQEAKRKTHAKKMAKVGRTARPQHAPTGGSRLASPNCCCQPGRVAPPRNAHAVVGGGPGGPAPPCIRPGGRGGAPAAGPRLNARALTPVSGQVFNEATGEYVNKCTLCAFEDRYEKM